jgi:hypothetical protein
MVMIMALISLMPLSKEEKKNIKEKENQNKNSL